jgi:hypothetical protein
MNHFPFFPKKFRHDEVAERVERFLRPGTLLAAQRSFQRLRESGAGAELSAVGPNPRAGDAVSAQALRPATMTAGSRHSTPFRGKRQ